MCVDKFDLLSKLAVVGPYIGFSMNDGRFILVQPSDITWRISANRLSQADKLNGVEWDGDIFLETKQRTRQFLNIHNKGTKWTWTEDNLSGASSIFIHTGPTVSGCYIHMEKGNPPETKQALVLAPDIIDAHPGILGIGGVPAGWK